MAKRHIKSTRAWGWILILGAIGLAACSQVSTQVTSLEPTSHGGSVSAAGEQGSYAATSNNKLWTSVNSGYMLRPSIGFTKNNLKSAGGAQIDTSPGAGGGP